MNKYYKQATYQELRTEIEDRFAHIHTKMTKRRIHSRLQTLGDIYNKFNSYQQSIQDKQSKHEQSILEEGELKNIIRARRKVLTLIPPLKYTETSMCTEPLDHCTPTNKCNHLSQTEESLPPLKSVKDCCTSTEEKVGRKQGSRSKRSAAISRRRLRLLIKNRIKLSYIMAKSCLHLGKVAKGRQSEKLRVKEFHGEKKMREDLKQMIILQSRGKIQRDSHC